MTTADRPRSVPFRGLPAAAAPSFSRMPALLTASDLSKTYGTRTLFSGVSLSLDERERLALIGPNGSGKSTLLKIIAGFEHADEGDASPRRGIRAAYVAQADAFDEGATVRTAVVSSLEAARRAGLTPQLHDDHEVELAADLVLSRLEFADLDQPASSLSGGQRKRLSIARELAKEPDVLLLDEPTNHLDVEGIAWLESLLRAGPFASIVVTHDRVFLESVATRIVELSRSYPEGTFSVKGNYSEFLRRKQEFLDGQARREESLANEVREDLRWLSRGAQARRTKSKSRIDASYDRMDELADLRARNAPHRSAAIEFDGTGRQTRKLVTARAVSKTLGGRKLFADVDVVLSPGSVLGLLGPNGSGKSTLIRVLMRELESDPPSEAAIRAAADEPQRASAIPLGSVQHADGLRTVVFSQHRTDFDPGTTLRDAISPQSDSVIFRGKVIHVNTWARKFLFTNEQLKAPIRALSGGELARIHIARLMLEPADVLILDEPTNDLDIPSLEVLEDSLEEFPGAIVLVTHDRAMLARLSTQVLALDGRGNARYYTDYEQWERRPRERAEPERDTKPAPKPQDAVPAQPATPKKKLTYNEQRELAQMETAIPKAEADAAALEAQTNDPAVSSDHRRMQEIYRKLGDAQAKVAALYERWAELEAKKG